MADKAPASPPNEACITLQTQRQQSTHRVKLGGSSGKVVEVVASKGVPTRLSAAELDKAGAAV